MKPKEFAEKIGVCVRTLQRWDVDGVLEANRTPSGRRYYTEEQLLKHVPNGEGSIAIDMSTTKFVPVLKIISGGKELFISVGMSVGIFTDGTDFEEEYLGEVKSVDKTGIELENFEDFIGWEYIRSIYDMTQST